jgi:hypothetical protein
VTASSWPMIIRVARLAASPANSQQPCPDGTTFAPK